MQAYKLMKYSFGFLISEITGTNPEVLALDEKMASEAAQAAAKVVSTGGQGENPNSNGPVFGAAAGREVIVTAITTIMIAVTMEPKPSHVTQPS